MNEISNAPVPTRIIGMPHLQVRRCRKAHRSLTAPDFAPTLIEGNQ